MNMFLQKLWSADAISKWKNTGKSAFLNVGDVRKYGQTTKGIRRYSQTDLNRQRLRRIDIFNGNQMKIRFQEKIMIYGYYIMNKLDGQSFAESVAYGKGWDVNS